MSTKENTKYRKNYRLIIRSHKRHKEFFFQFIWKTFRAMLTNPIRPDHANFLANKK